MTKQMHLVWIPCINERRTTRLGAKVQCRIYTCHYGKTHVTLRQECRTNSFQCVLRRDSGYNLYPKQNKIKRSKVIKKQKWLLDGANVLLVKLVTINFV
jgi:hypothetical protein